MVDRDHSQQPHELQLNDAHEPELQRDGAQEPVPAD
jgi:hypothetical protein